MSVLQSIQCLGWLQGFQETLTLEHMSKHMWVPHGCVFPWSCSLGSNNIRLAITLTFRYSKFLSTPAPEDWGTLLPPSSPVCQSTGDCGLTLPLSAIAGVLLVLQWSTLLFIVTVWSPEILLPVRHQDEVWNSGSYLRPDGTSLRPERKSSDPTGLQYPVLKHCFLEARGRSNKRARYKQFQLQARGPRLCWALVNKSSFRGLASSSAMERRGV